MPLVLGTQQASSPALLDLLGHGDHAGGHEPEHSQHEDTHSFNKCENNGHVSESNEHLLLLAVLASHDEDHPRRLAGESLPELHTLPFSHG